MTTLTRIVPDVMLDIRRPQRLIERSALVYRRNPLVIITGFFEPLFYLLSIRTGLSALVGDVEVGGRLVPYEEFVAPGLMASAAMNGAIFDSTMNIFHKWKHARLYDAVLATPKIEPERIYASVRQDPRTAQKFDHEDGICMYILEYANGFRAMSLDDVWTGPAVEGAEKDIGIRWRVEGTEGMSRGTIGWPEYPKPTPSTIDFTTIDTGKWHKPRWRKVWFPDAFVGPMADLLIALETDSKPTLDGADNLKTMALVDACYLSAKEHRAVELREITEAKAQSKKPGKAKAAKQKKSKKK